MAFGRRGYLWLGWTFQLLFTGFNAVLCFMTYTNMKEIYDLKWEDSDSADYAKDSIWGVMAASMMNGLLIIMFNVVSFWVLAKKSWERSGAGFGYGLLVSATFHLAFFSALCGITQQGWELVAERWEGDNRPWSSTDTAVLVITYVTSYMSSAVWGIMLGLLLNAKGAMSKFESNERYGVNSPTNIALASSRPNSANSYLTNNNPLSNP